MNTLDDKFSCRNRDKKRIGVGVHVEDCVNFKIRNDIIRIDETLEYSWAEVLGKNKDHPT